MNLNSWPKISGVALVASLLFIALQVGLTQAACTTTGVIDVTLNCDDVTANETTAGGNDTLTATGSITNVAVVDLGSGSNVGNVGVDITNGSRFITGAGNDSLNVGGNVQNGGNVDLGDGNNTATVGANFQNGATFTTGAGNDSLNVGGSIQNGGNIEVGNGNNTVVAGGSLQNGSSIISGVGNDSLTVGGSVQNGGSINAGDGDDTVNINGGGVINGANINLGTGNNNLFVNGNVLIGGNITATGTGNNSIVVKGAISNTTLGSGNDTVFADGRVSEGGLNLGDGNNQAYVGSVGDGGLRAGTGDDYVLVTGNSSAGGINVGEGNNVVIVYGNTRDSGITAGTGDDIIYVYGSIFDGGIFAGLGTNEVRVYGSVNGAGITAIGGNNVVLVGGDLNAFLGTGGGDDWIQLRGNSFGFGDADFGGGNDLFEFTGDQINTSIVGSTGNDTFRINGRSNIGTFPLDGGLDVDSLILVFDDENLATQADSALKGLVFAPGVPTEVIVGGYRYYFVNFESARVFLQLIVQTGGLPNLADQVICENEQIKVFRKFDGTLDIYAGFRQFPPNGLRIALIPANSPTGVYQSDNALAWSVELRADKKILLLDANGRILNDQCRWGG